MFTSCLIHKIQSK